MQIIRRSCQAALSAPRVWSPVANGSRRAFSQSSTCQRGSLPQFQEPSSPKLEALLSRVNAKVLLPQHLTKEQAKLVYKQENRARVESEPIEITLGDVTLPLEHIDRNRDQPGRWEAFREVLVMSKTPEDWENVLRLLEGYHDAGIRFGVNQYRVIVRRMFAANMHHLVLKALQRVEKTGLRLREHYLIMTVFQGLHFRAAKSEFAEEDTTKMLRFAEQCVELMEEPEHLGRKDIVPGDSRTLPDVIAVPAALAVARAKKHLNGKDEDGKVKRYTSRLIEALQQQHNVDRLNEQLDSIDTARKTEDGRAAISRHMKVLVPIWQALKTSREVLGEDMPAAKFALKVERELQDGLRKGFERVTIYWPDKRPLLVVGIAEQCAKL